MVSKLIVLISCITICLSYYSKSYKKCRLFTNKNDIGTLQLQRIPQYAIDFEQLDQTHTTIPLQYEDIDFILDQFIDAGGSGQVFRVEDQKTGQIRILKRFFEENMLQFQQQNYVMNKMNYDVKWHKQDNNPNKSTIASYPSKQSVVLRDLQTESSQQIAVVFYKLCRQLAKTHKRGIIHNDLKMGNILISSIGEGLRTVQVQLIDWNLLSFYFRGYESTEKKGTICYYSPESMLRTSFLTPAIDIWSLAVVFFTFISDKKPFTLNCKDDNLQAIITYTGNQQFLNVYEKYRKSTSSQAQLVDHIKQNTTFYQGISLRDRIPSQYQKSFDNQFIDLFQKMLQIDPEYRLTIVQVLNHPYFDRVKRLPKKYLEKNKKKKKDQKVQVRQAPANNLVPVVDPNPKQEPSL